MADVLQKNKMWKNPPIPVLKKDEDICHNDDDDMDDEALAGNDVVPLLLQEANSSQDPEEVASGISQLANAGMIGKKLTDCLETLHRSSFKRLSGTSLPMFEVDAETPSMGKKIKRKHSLFVEVKHNSKTFFINKTTAVWLFQEGERVSSDRLFRVRSKEPYTSDPQPKLHSTSNKDPAVNQLLEVGSICVFKDSKSLYKIGRVLQFAYYLEKTKSSQQYRGTTVHLTDKAKKIGVLCWLSPSGKFSMVLCEEAHQFIPVTSYVCTLSHGCFEKIESAEDVNVQSSIMNQDPHKLNLATAQHLILTASALSIIKNLLDTSDTDNTLKDPHSDPSETEEYWVKYGTATLSRKDMQQIVTGKELSDLHVNAFQNLLKMRFPNTGGLQSTLFQLKSLSSTWIQEGKLYRSSTLGSHTGRLLKSQAMMCAFMTQPTHLQAPMH